MAEVVRPEIHTITLASGETLIIKKKLNTGERRNMLGMMRGPDGRMDGLISNRATVLEYLLDWTVKDQDGKPLIIKGKPIDEVRQVLDALDHEDYKEIENAINDYDEQITAARRAEKKIQVANAQSGSNSGSASDGQARSGSSSSTDSTPMTGTSS